MNTPTTDPTPLASGPAPGEELTRTRQLGRGGGTAGRLAEEAARAAEVRALSTDPDVVALRIERVRVQVDRLAWAGIVLGLGFTMTNVQAFAAGTAPAWSTTWIAAWALDPMMSLVLIAVLRAEQVTARWEVRPGPWVRRARWTTLLATYAMNTWSAWAAGVPSQVVLHSVPPLVVFVAAEAVTGLREALTQAVHVAAASRTPRPDMTPDVAEREEAPARRQAPELPVAETETADPDTDAHDPDTPSQPRVGGALDPRVRELAELLAAGEPVTGAQAGALHAVSARSGRRMLAAAQAAVDDGVVTSRPADADLGAKDGAAPVLLSVAGWS